MFAQKMFREQDGLHGLRAWIDSKRFARQAGNKFQHNGVMDRVINIFAPRERSVARNEDGRML